MTDSDEPILVQRAVDGDYAAFSQLVARYEKRLYALAWHVTHDHHEAQDVVQNALLSAVEHMGEFRGESSFSTWLARITINYALKALRARRTRRTQPLDRPDDDDADLPPPEYIADWREDPLTTVSGHELRAILDDGLAQLSEGQRLVFVLRDVEGLSTAEAAESLGITETNVKVRLLRARLALREYLTRRFGDEKTRQTPSHEGHDHSALLARLVHGGGEAQAHGGKRP